MPANAAPSLEDLARHFKMKFSTSAEGIERQKLDPSDVEAVRLAAREALSLFMWRKKA